MFNSDEIIFHLPGGLHVYKRRNRIGRRAHLFIAAFLVTLIGGTACEYGDDNYRDNIEVAKKEGALRGGDVVEGFTGVVEFYSAIPGKPGWFSSCTGSMIAPNVVLTAAHCFDKLRSGSAKDGNWSFHIKYHDPQNGLRDVYNGNAYWAVLPSYDGAKDFPADTNSDLGVIKIDGMFERTDYHDYLRIYSDKGSDLKDHWLSFYGAGIHTYSGKEDDNLRTAKFEVEDYDYNHIVIDNREKVCVCKGDSGGPFVRTTSGIPTIAAVLSGSELLGSEPDVCANNDPPFDDGFACRTNWRHMQWVENVTGLSCALQTGASHDYRRCFELPFIEDVPLEGQYSKEVAVALSEAARLSLL